MQRHGLTITAAINTFARKAVREYRIPFEIGVIMPNEDTIEAMREIERLRVDDALGKTYTNVHEMMRTFWQITEHNVRERAHRIGAIARTQALPILSRWMVGHMNMKSSNPFHAAFTCVASIPQPDLLWMQDIADPQPARVLHMFQLCAS